MSGCRLHSRFSRAGFATTGFDTNASHIRALNAGADPNGEVAEVSLQGSTARFSFDPADLAGSTTFVIAVPTPVTDAKKPDMEPLLAACRIIAPHLKPGSLVIVESTVYPGVTEEVCGPALALASGLKMYDDIKLAYSPERINPWRCRAFSGKRGQDHFSAGPGNTSTRVAAIYSPLV